VSAKKPLRQVPPQPAIFIGTHALLTQLPLKLPFPLAALAIDEQHKFGVQQRAELLTRKPTPHLFNLTATPIPRSLALGLFGEVAISSLSDKPKNRLPIKTWVLDPDRFKKSTAWLKQQIEKGSQVFAVAPTIHGVAEKEGAIKIFKHYQTVCGSFTKVFLIHGQMKSEAIALTLAAFKKTTGGILVATTPGAFSSPPPSSKLVSISQRPTLSSSTAPIILDWPLFTNCAAASAGGNARAIVYSSAAVTRKRPTPVWR
ncbi:MAG: ATP-dependent DNA helicase RecG, partial [Parcubacteria group bacterium GW2011_GWA1_51_12]